VIRVRANQHLVLRAVGDRALRLHRHHSHNYAHTRVATIASTAVVFGVLVGLAACGGGTSTPSNASAACRQYTEADSGANKGDIRYHSARMQSVGVRSNGRRVNVEITLSKSARAGGGGGSVVAAAVRLRRAGRVLGISAQLERQDDVWYGNRSAGKRIPSASNPLPYDSVTAGLSSSGKVVKLSAEFDQLAGDTGAWTWEVRLGSDFTEAARYAVSACSGPVVAENS
jgi:hypothetical protein